MEGRRKRKKTEDWWGGEREGKEKGGKRGVGCRGRDDKSKIRWTRPFPHPFQGYVSQHAGAGSVGR